MSETTPQIDGAPSAEAQFGDFYRLLKPRVMALVVFTALAGMIAAPVHEHPVIAFAALLCIAVGAGASGALNMWWDADIDARMRRTCRRPIPTGLIEPGEALGLGLGLAGASVMLLGLFTNALAGGLLAFTIFFYVVIYSVGLKRRTPQNIVIGGAAGAFPPMIAWAAMTGGVELAPVLMFLVIFLWTPPHFWALALFRNEDYRKVDLPMLPVVAGGAETRRQIWLYSLLLAPIALAPALTAAAGPVYLAVALWANAVFLARAHSVRRRSEADSAADGFAAEKRLFGFSIVYLFALFGALIADGLLRLALGAAWPSWGWI